MWVLPALVCHVQSLQEVDGKSHPRVSRKKGGKGHCREGKGFYHVLSHDVRNAMHKALESFATLCRNTLLVPSEALESGHRFVPSSFWASRCISFFLVTKGIATRNKELLVAPSISTRNKVRY